ncbi:MAG: DUF481 domain-containing protein [Methylotenera sp.]|nr:DUF481 domain-containing protein [Oligoflexia bacterium]
MKTTPSRIFILIVFACVLCATSALAADVFHNESEAGVVIASGNTRSQSYNFKQINTQTLNKDLIKFEGRLLKTSNRSIETARFWTLGLRYERELTPVFSLFAAETLESDRFAGYLQRYNSDLGGKYFFYKEELFTWSAEAGYRYSIENRAAGQSKFHYLRAYTEALKGWSKSVSTKAWLEYLPNLTAGQDYKVNGEASVSAALTEIFSIKTAYLVKYEHQPAPPATERTNTWFTTALVAQF